MVANNIDMNSGTFKIRRHKFRSTYSIKQAPILTNSGAKTLNKGAKFNTCYVMFGLLYWPDT
jgi:hypothetical protein